MAVASALGWLARLAANWIWPPEGQCCGCGRPAPPSERLRLPPAHLCSACCAAAPFPPDAWLCARCTRPLDGPWSLCPDCASGQVAFGRAAAVGCYRPPLSTAICRLKYTYAPAVAIPLGELLASAVLRVWPRPPFAAVVPVPVDPQRLRRRGYNQAALIARQVARRLGLPFQPGWLRRARHAPAQARLGRQARLQNLTGVFRAPPLPGRPHLLVVDDVLTTGATLSAAAEALYAAGAGRVDVAVVAVSPRPVW